MSQKVYREGDWPLHIVKDANLAIKDEEVFPICIVSYKRGHNASTIQHLKNTTAKKYLFIYRDDYENYKTVEEDPEYVNFEIVFVDIPEKGLHYKREFVNNYMRRKGYDYIFQLDDDIEKTVVGEQVKNTSPNNKRDTVVKLHKIELIEGLKTTQYSFMANKDEMNIGVFGCVTFFEITLKDFHYEKEVSSNKLCCNCVLLNLKLLEEKDIHYNTEVKTWEDLDLCLRCEAKGVGSCINTFLNYKVVDRRKQKSVVFGELKKEDGRYNENIAIYNIRMYKLWGDILKIVNEDGGLNFNSCLRKVHNKVKKGEEIIINYDEKILELCDESNPRAFYDYTNNIIKQRKADIKNRHFNNIEKFIDDILDNNDFKNKDYLEVESYIKSKCAENKNIPSKYIKAFFIEENEKINEKINNKINI